VSKPANRKTIWIVFSGLVIFILGYTLFQYLRIRNEIPVEITASDQHPDRKPIRVPRFTPPENVSYPPRFMFTYDSPRVLKNYRKIENLDRIVEGCRNDFELARKLMKWSRSQWKPGRPDPYPPINALDILREIRANRTGGFCAQYNYVFVQGLHSFGIRARYVTIVNHEVTEVWIPTFHRWVCFDPLYDAYYSDRMGTPLSVYEIVRNVRNQQQVRIHSNQPVTDPDSHLRQFARFAVWLKNDHVSSPINFSDLEYFKVYFVESPDERNSIPAAALSTSSVNDLYFSPK
jgi:transglutaminase-like putative cysteine protease